MKIVTIEELNRRIQEKFPNQPYEILEYSKMTKPFTIKCLKCNRVKQYSTPSNFLNSGRLGICICYNSKNHLNKHYINRNKILDIIKNNKDISFEKFGYNKDKKYTITVKCNKCNQFYTKTWQSFLKNSDCYYCGNKQKMNTTAYKTLLSSEYTLLSDYIASDSKITVRHKCGFIWKTTPHILSNYVGCPKCNHKRSKGERRVENFLKEQKIAYCIEQSFEWQTNLKRRYDFYLPEYNMVIEYMGEQHYRDRKEYFGISLEEQQMIDKEKKIDANKAGLDYLAICYKDYNQIEEILSQKLIQRL